MQSGKQRDAERRKNRKRRYRYRTRDVFTHSGQPTKPRESFPPYGDLINKGCGQSLIPVNAISTSNSTDGFKQGEMVEATTESSVHPSVLRLPVDGTAVLAAVRRRDGMLGRLVAQRRDGTGTVTIPIEHREPQTANEIEEEVACASAAASSPNVIWATLISDVPAWAWPESPGLGLGSALKTPKPSPSQAPKSPGFGPSRGFWLVNFRKWGPGLAKFQAEPKPNLSEAGPSRGQAEKPGLRGLRPKPEHH
ncbi:hypothetical protein K438DRAFT_1758298 [Mycena galopus ATCC 62051]|nr:hypothetical protein K438DRAFT_1758298 [Mycena galopus ATCC 62051]